ncbi:MAG: BON domain-containing protein [Flavisolibacter sp.]
MKSDAQIQQDVMNELKWNPYLQASRIGVSVKNAIVTLSGQVDSYSHKIEAERSAKKVTGVAGIAEDIQIGVSPVYKKTDPEIAESVLHALKWHSAVPNDKIKIKVEDGVVTLEGLVDWDFQRNSARNAMVNLTGVRNVINLITIRVATTATDVKNKISEAFHRAATIDAHNINVEVVGNKAILRGKVRSLAEKEDAADAAWCAPGISIVENHLELVMEEAYSF